MISQDMLLHGSADPLPEWIPLRAGPLGLWFDPENLSLRYIRVGGDEMVRAIYAAVRDRNWGTIPPRVANLELCPGPDRFTISFDARCQQREIDYLWHGTLTGGPDGRVRFSFDGQARSRFLRNRIGICVLHPIRECAGQPCCVEHTDGTVERSCFPRLIAPTQPFRDVRALSHTTSNGGKAEVRFMGDVFETEDQRNWTDASFKTYSTPLDLPFPVEVSEGMRVHQEVTLSVTTPTGSVGCELKEPCVAVEWSRRMPLPQVGFMMSARGANLGAREMERLRALQPGHVRFDVRFSDREWKRQLGRVISNAARLGVSLQLALHLSDDAAAELRELLKELSPLRPSVSVWIVHHAGGKAASDRWVRMAEETLSSYKAGLPFAAGTDAYFAEWNRNRPSSESRALPCYSLNPQVHAFDLATLVENLGGQADTVHTAFEITGRLVVVGPVTLRPSFNPNAPAAADETATGALPSQVDPRQMSLFGAAWTLGSLAALAGTGRVQSVTYYETTGWFGIMETEEGSLLPEQFPSIPGGVFPMYHVFADLAGYRQVCPLSGADGRRVAGLGLEGASGEQRVLFANLDRTVQPLRLALDWESARVQIIDGTNVERAMREPEVFRADPGRTVRINDGHLELLLPPFAVARADKASPRT